MPTSELQVDNAKKKKKSAFEFIYKKYQHKSGSCRNSRKNKLKVISNITFKVMKQMQCTAVIYWPEISSVSLWLQLKFLTSNVICHCLQGGTGTQERRLPILARMYFYLFFNGGTQKPEKVKLTTAFVLAVSGICLTWISSHRVSKQPTGV